MSQSMSPQMKSQLTLGSPPGKMLTLNNVVCMWIFYLAVTLETVSGYAHGAPNAACDKEDMAPGHKDSASPERKIQPQANNTGADPLPYRIKFYAENITYNPGNPIVGEREPPEVHLHLGLPCRSLAAGRNLSFIYRHLIEIQHLSFGTHITVFRTFNIEYPPLILFRFNISRSQMPDRLLSLVISCNKNKSLFCLFFFIREVKNNLNVALFSKGIPTPIRSITH